MHDTICLSKSIELYNRNSEPQCVPIKKEGKTFRNLGILGWNADYDQII